jgi:hypothetical protein
MLLVNLKGSDNVMGNWWWNNKITMPHQWSLGTLRSHHAPLSRLLACHFATHGKPKPFDVWLATISIDGWIRFKPKKPISSP